MNHILARSRIITVPLNRCVDEFGNLYGGNNSHFLVDAVGLLPDEEALKQHLRDSYKNNTLQSVNEALATNIGHPYGEHYFLPWEDSRVRQLDRFLFSHKIGPTPEQALPLIIKRLREVFHSINKYGYRPACNLGGYPRVIPLSDGTVTVYMLRDGNHRAAVLSHFKNETIEVIHDQDYFTPSTLASLLQRKSRRKNRPSLSRRVVSPEFSNEWPHVRNGVITQALAEKLFIKKYARCFRSAENEN